MTQVAANIIGPADDGRRMSLDEFDTAIGQEGHLYELSRGVIVVSDVPDPPHARVVHTIRQEITLYHAAHPNVVHYIFAGSECKLLIEGTESERHPDIAVYKTPAPGMDATVWSVWVPEIVIEVVSADSAERDYNEKPEDYLQFGVLEYWVIDPTKAEATIHRRTRGRWKLQTLKAGENYSTPLLPEFVLDISALLPQ